MDWGVKKGQILTLVKNHRIILLLLLIGIFLMVFPEQERSEIIQQPLAQEEEISLENKLEKLLSNVEGAGTVEVLLTYAQGEETIFQSDHDLSAEERRSDTVLVTNKDRDETGLIKQINPPIYLGAVILCQGADNASVQLSIVKAVMSVTGLTSDHITVLKMK